MHPIQVYSVDYVEINTDPEGPEEGEWEEVDEGEGEFHYEVIGLGNPPAASISIKFNSALPEGTKVRVRGTWAVENEPPSWEPPTGTATATVNLVLPN